MTAALTFLFAFTLQTFFLYPLLSGQTALVHDNFYWNYPVFHYFAESIAQGFLPLWDPYNTGGQPFYPVWLQFRLLDPLVPLVVYVGKFFTLDTAIWFNWLRWLQSWILVAGTYGALSRYCRESLTRILLILSLSLSSFVLGSFHQDGIISQFLWLPFIFQLVRSIVFDGRDARWRYALLGALIGLNWQSYHFAGVWIWLVLSAGVFFVAYRSALQRWWQTPGRAVRLALLFFPVVLMMGPNLVSLWESQDYIFPLRRLPGDYQQLLAAGKSLSPLEGGSDFVELGLKVPAELLNYTGAFIKGWNLLQALSPDANGNTHGLKNDFSWGHPSEAYLYLGVLIWGLAIYGWFKGRESHRAWFATNLAGFGILMLGPPAGLHRLLYPIFPPLWFVRHTQLFLPFFLFSVYYFFILGCDAALAGRFPKFKKRDGYGIALCTVLFLFGWLGLCLDDYQRASGPLGNLLWVPLTLLIATGYFAARYFSAEALTLSFLLAQGALCLLFDPLTAKAGTILTLGLIVPTILHYQFPRTFLLKGTLVALVVLDLGYSFFMAQRVYNWQPPISQLFPLDTRVTTPRFTPTRETFPDYPEFFWGHQVPRYLGVFYRRPFALSSVFYYLEDRDVRSQDLEQSLKAKRWNSYLLYKEYFELVTTKSVAEIREALRVGQSVLYATDPQATFEIAHYLPSQLVLRTHASRPTTLAWADGYSRAWKAKIDGQATPIQRRANFGKEIVLPEGDHTIEFTYRPEAFLWALLLFGLSPGLALTYAFSRDLFERSGRNPIGNRLDFLRR